MQTERSGILRLLWSAQLCFALCLSCTGGHHPRQSSLLPYRDLTGPREMLVEAAVDVWVFLQKMNTPDSEQVSRAGGTREAPRAGPGRCIMVHYSDALQVTPKYSTHLHLSCSKHARAPLAERFAEPPWVVRSWLEQFSVQGWVTSQVWAVPREMGPASVTLLS